jgi:hypothetical protein
MVTMSQKSSVPQAAKPVSQALMPDTPDIGLMQVNANFGLFDNWPDAVIAICRDIVALRGKHM